MTHATPTLTVTPVTRMSPATRPVCRAGCDWTRLGLALVAGMAVAGPAAAQAISPSGSDTAARPTATASRVWFTEMTDAVGLTSKQGCDSVLPTCSSRMLNMGGGAATGDFNRDGHQDLFILAAGSEPDKLMLNNGDGTFSIAPGALPGDLHSGCGVSVGDFNNDGWLDAFVTSFGDVPGPLQQGKHRLYRNEGVDTQGNIHFTDIAIDAGVNYSTVLEDSDGFGSCFGDYDLDGDLDLIVCGWKDTVDGTRVFRNDRGEARNNGITQFTDVTDTLLPTIHDTRVHGFSPQIVDLTGDGLPDILIVADFLTSRFFVNNGDGTFTDTTTAMGLGLDQNGMGHTVGDFDNDGLLDLYVCAIYGNNGLWAGNGAVGNRLYMNRPAMGGFVELAEESGSDDGGWGWGSDAVDVNLDGLTDIIETNGWFDESSNEFMGEQGYLFINQGTDASGMPLFDEQALERGYRHFELGRGLLTLDADSDGDRDLVVVANDGPLMYFRAETAVPGATWIRVFLDTSSEAGLAPDGFGSIVRVTAGGVTQTHSLDGSCNFLSQSELSAHFGLGGLTTIDELRVEWSDGTVTSLIDVPTNQTMTVTPSAGIAAVALPPRTFFAGYALGDLRTADVNADGVVDTADALAYVAGR